MDTLHTLLHRARRTYLDFLRWLVLGSAVGVVVAFAGAGFHHLTEYARAIRLANGWLLFLLPLAGLLIVALYQFAGMYGDRGTNAVLLAVRENEAIPLRIFPLISVSTALTHLTGGSSGREGAALQLGSSIASFLGRKLRLPDKEARVLAMCGMAAGFSAVFGTPLASAVFALEVVSVGAMHYAALAPCMAAALVAQQVASWLGCGPVGFGLVQPPETGWAALAAGVVLGVLCGLLGWFEAVVFRTVHHLYEKKLPNPYLRVAAGAVLVIGMTLLLGTRDYNGAGMDGIIRAVAGQALPWAFACKLLMTALTLGAGFKGGEIVPTFFIGATFGCTVGAWLGLPAGFAAALGMVGLFCAVTNAPLASILLAYELFGGAGLPLFALVCAVTYRLSGYGGLYGAQQIIYSKETVLTREDEEAEEAAEYEARVEKRAEQVKESLRAKGLAVPDPEDGMAERQLDGEGEEAPGRGPALRR
ncbi:MAG: chloride channel protein [Clostridiaceae bacterium]|nr:chloride channel protein [Clostridiaceae bacterium]